MVSQQFLLQEIEIPEGISLTFSEFYRYDPSLEFTKDLSEKYLSEDLFQASFDEGQLIIDMGWYGDQSTNKGQFKVLVIYASDWDFPVITLYAKSLSEVTQILEKTLAHMVSEEFN